MDIRYEVEQRKEKIIAWRQWFHEHPEPGFAEEKTSKKIMEILDELGICYTQAAKTGVTAVLGRGEKTAALRADMDGLPIEEETGLPYASREPGYMHACGHDGHIAALLGAAAVLKAKEEELPCRVKLIFQPSEENACGAKKMIEEGILNGVDEIFGLHLFSHLPFGQIDISDGPRMAISDWFEITLTGKSGHGGKPQECIDATVAAASLVMNLQTIISRGINPIKSAVVTVGRLESGTAANVISGEARLSGTVRTYSLEDSGEVRDRMEQMLKGLELTYGVRADMNYRQGAHPAVVNDRVPAARVRKAAEKLFGSEAIKESDRLMLGEDFACYQALVPGVFAFVGTGGYGREKYPNHHPGFTMPEEAPLVGAMLHLAFVMSVEEKESK